VSVSSSRKNGEFLNLQNEEDGWRRNHILVVYSLSESSFTVLKFYEQAQPFQVLMFKVWSRVVSGN
jgi:hypothetical protein